MTSVNLSKYEIPAVVSQVRFYLPAARCRRCWRWNVYPETTMRAVTLRNHDYVSTWFWCRACDLESGALFPEER